ncbi:hypothetical protein CRUP_024292 [Coryphaenoides rupestris]|nr:hypothetical protein CRUP_024292 [Coryphaenoides rupestris]
MDYLPDKNSRYQDVDYWDERYRTERCFDWFGEFSKFKHLLETLVDQDQSILVLAEPAGAAACILMPAPDPR